MRAKEEEQAKAEKEKKGAKTAKKKSGKSVPAAKGLYHANLGSVYDVPYTAEQKTLRTAASTSA